jgi:glycosyltransferase involved in cell wall biosynthesis
LKVTRVLIFIDWFLPGTASGGPVRSIANMLQHLNEGFEFYVVTRNTDYQSDRPYEGIQSDIWVKFNAYTQVYYFSKAQLSKRQLKRLFTEINFDMAFINGIYSWYFSILPLYLLKSSNKSIVVSARGMLNSQAFSVKPLKKQAFLKLAKYIGLYRNINFHATNQDEKQSILTYLGQNTRVFIAPNLPRKMELSEPKEKLNTPRTFVSVGRIAKEKGTLTLLRALLQIETEMILDLYGPIYDRNYWETCQQIIEKMPNQITINYRGVIPGEQVPDVLSQYDFFVLLSEGENFGHAIFEAFSQGLPVIISNNTPWKDLLSKGLGWDLNIKNETYIINVLKSALEMPLATYQKWSEACILFAKEFNTKPELINQNKALFLNAIKNHNQ